MSEFSKLSIDAPTKFKYIKLGVMDFAAVVELEAFYSALR